MDQLCNISCNFSERAFTAGIKKELEQVSNLQAKLAALQDKENTLQPKLHETASDKEKLVQKIETTEQLISKQKNVQEYQTQQLTKGAKLYKKLGLDFERVGEDRLKLVFTMIDPNRHDREFYFVVHVDANDKYSVEDINPPVGSIQDAISALNSNNDFSLFVKRMRKKFQALCT